MILIRGFFSRGSVMISSFYSGFLTMTVGVTFVYPGSSLYSTDRLWFGYLTILWGLSIMVGNFYYLWKGKRAKNKAKVKNGCC